MRHILIAAQTAAEDAETTPSLDSPNSSHWFRFLHASLPCPVIIVIEILLMLILILVWLLHALSFYTSRIRSLSSVS